MRILVAALLSIMFTTLIVAVNVSYDIAWFIGYGGTALILLVAIMYVAIKDPLGHWPGRPWRERLANVLFLSRR
jgi:hypothetical protein